MLNEIPTDNPKAFQLTMTWVSLENQDLLAPLVPQVLKGCLDTTVGKEWPVNQDLLG
nr:unnamed protein product [Callosobruchus chinensis]